MGKLNFTKTGTIAVASAFAFAFLATPAEAQRAQATVSATPPATKTPSPQTASVWRGPTAEQQAQIVEMKREIERFYQQLSEAKTEDEKLTGGLIKAQIGMRIEIVRNTISLLEHRIKAVETGAKFVPMEIAGSSPDASLVESIERDISATKERLADSRANSERYSGGLIKAQIESTIATQNQTLAMLEQRQLMAKYGLARTTLPSEHDLAHRKSSGVDMSGAGAERKKVSPMAAPGDGIVTVDLLSKERVKQKYDEMIVLNMNATAAGLDRPARAIKGTLKVTDLFGEIRMSIGWSFDNPIVPGGVIQERGTGVKYNQFNDASRWLDSTDQQNMRVVFTVKSILYEDGTRRDF